jgi:hypothetical protein
LHHVQIIFKRIINIPVGIGTDAQPVYEKKLQILVTLSHKIKTKNVGNMVT